MEYSKYLSQLIKFSKSPKLIFSTSKWITAIDHMRSLETENKALKNWVWHKKYEEASSQGASHEIAKDFADNGITSLINKSV